MGFTPIFDELCREHAEAGRAHPAETVALAPAEDVIEDDAPEARERTQYAQGGAREWVA